MGYFEASSPLVPHVLPPKAPSPAGVVIIYGDSEEVRVLETMEKDPIPTLRGRESAAKVRSRDLGVWKFFRGIGRLVRLFGAKVPQGDQYAGEKLPYLLRAGTFPSAGGARAPLSNVSSKPPIVIFPWAALDSAHRSLFLFLLLEFIASLTVSMVPALVFCGHIQNAPISRRGIEFYRLRFYRYMLQQEHRC